MKNSKAAIWLNSAEWLKQIPELNPQQSRNQNYFNSILKYIARSYLDQSEKAGLSNREYSFTAGHSGEVISHLTKLHIFSHCPKQLGYFWEAPGANRNELEPNETVGEAMNRLRADGQTIDAIVVQVSVSSSKLGLIAETFDVVIQEGSSLENSNF